MRLADHFLAARDTIADYGGFATSMGPWIEKAQRFEIADEVARAAGDLIHSRPSTLAAALPLCRLPYETMWIECRGGLLSEGAREFDGALPPWKQGVLIESMPGGQTGFMTVCWMHQVDVEKTDWLHPVNISPISVFFAWQEDGDVHHLVRSAHEAFLDTIPDASVRRIVEAFRTYLEKKWMTGWADDPVRVNAVFTGRRGWEKHVGNPREQEAMRTLDRHTLPGLSPHGMGLAAYLLTRMKSDKDIIDLMLKWEADMQGEAGWVQCLLAMLNSRNPVVEHAPVDLTKLNKSRRKLGRPEFLPYSKTRLALSRSQARIARARGMDREAARLHSVMGHFKIRKSGVYWWSPFFRGDPRRGTVPRKEYEVHE